jgi:hypothetical protein
VPYLPSLCNSGGPLISKQASFLQPPLTLLGD